MITLRKAEDRGRANFGWLDSKHTFSFGHYYDPKHMGFSSLRVINDDIVKPGAGFDTHGHRDMEIISYVLEGAIEHKDSEGNIKKLPAGEFQLMSAGKGILHSEYNASKNEKLRFLQIWVEPNTFGNQPRYQQKAFGSEHGITTIASPEGEHGAFKIKQAMKLHQLVLAPNAQLSFSSNIGNKIYLHQVAGYLQVNNELLTPGDGAKITAERKLSLTNKSDEQVTALIFELA